MLRCWAQENGPTKGSFLDRSCALIPRALTGTHNGQVVKMHTPTDAQSMQLKLEQLRPSTGVGRGGATEGGMEATTIAITTLLQCPHVRSTTKQDVKLLENQATDNREPDFDLCVSKAWSRANLQEGLPSFINFVSMDVEGLELEILTYWPFKSVRVGAW